MERDYMESYFKRNNTLISILTWVLCLLFAANSMINIAWSDIIYQSPELYNSFLANDYINIFFGVPILVISLILVRHHIKLGLMGWVGSILFVVYNEIAYLFAVRNTYSMIANAIIVGIGLITIILILISIDYTKILDKEIPIKRTTVYGLVLVIMGLIFVARAVVNIISTVSGHGVLTVPEIGVNIADVVICTLWIMSGILLIRKTKLGFIISFISYIQGSMLFLALMFFMVFQPIILETEFLVLDFAVIVIMSLTFLIPLFFLIHKFTGAFDKNP